MSHAGDARAGAGGGVSTTAAGTGPAGTPPPPQAAATAAAAKKAQTVVAPTLTKLQTVGAANQATKHVGAEGSEYVLNLLRNVKPPTLALEQVQATCGLSNPLCQPLLVMLDYLGVPRREAHLHILNRSKDMLLRWIADMKATADRQAAQRLSSSSSRGHAYDDPEEPESQEEMVVQERLERLLIASFKYMGVAELKQVPIEVMNAMSRVPAPFLKQLAEEREIFNELPQAVKQQVYEYERSLLQQDSVQYIAAYKYESATVKAALNMSLYVRQRAPLCRRQQQQQQQQQQGGRFARGGGVGGGVGGGPLFPPKKPGAGGGASGGGGMGRPGSGGSGGGAGGVQQQQQRRPGFSVANVLNAVSKGIGPPPAPPPTQQQQQQPGQWTPLRTPPRSPSVDGGPLSVLQGIGGVGGSAQQTDGSGAGGGGGSGGGSGGRLVPRSTLRKGSAAIKALLEMVGSSNKIYTHLVDLCKVRLQETDSPYLGVKETSYCQLRTQLLMALHDSDKTGVSAKQNPGGGGAAGAGGVGGGPPRHHRDAGSKAQLPGDDPSYKLAWTLDAAIANRQLTVRHLGELARTMAKHLQPPPRFIEEQDDSGSIAAAAAAAGGSGGGRKRGGPSAAASKLLPKGFVSSSMAATAAAAAAAAAGGGAAGGAKRRRERGSNAGGGGWDSEDCFEEDGWLIRDEPQPKKKKGGAGGAAAAAGGAAGGGAGAAAEGDALDAADVRGNLDKERWLGDAAMILRDPPALHLLAAEFVEVLYRCLALRRLPADEPQVEWLLQLMELAVSARTCLREKRFSMPPVPLIKIKHTAELQQRGGGGGGAPVSVELSPEEVAAAWSSRGGGKAGAGTSALQQRQSAGGSSDDEQQQPYGGGSSSSKARGYDLHKRTRGGREYEIWFTDHDQLTELWPEVMAVLAEGEALAQPWQPDPSERDVAPLSVAGWSLVVGAYAGYELVRQVVQMLILDRVLGGDLITAHRLLRVVVSSAHLSSPAAEREYGPFAHSLAVILQDLIKTRRLSASSGFFKLAFGEVLLRVVDAGTDVHDEYLRLLLEAVNLKQVTPEALAHYLGTMLELTKDSRTRLQDRREEFSKMQAHHTGGGLDTIPGYVNFSSTHHDWSDGFRLVRQQKYNKANSGDKFGGVYSRLVAVGGLQNREELWPDALQDFMQAAAGRQRADDATRRAERQAEQQQQQQRAAAAAAAGEEGEEEEEEEQDGSMVERI